MHVFELSTLPAARSACCHAWRIAGSFVQKLWMRGPRTVDRPAVGRWDSGPAAWTGSPMWCGRPYVSLFAGPVAVRAAVGTGDARPWGLGLKWGGKGSRYRRHASYCGDGRGDCGCDCGRGRGLVSSFRSSVSSPIISLLIFTALRSTLLPLSPGVLPAFLPPTECHPLSHSCRGLGIDEVR